MPKKAATPEGGPRELRGNQTVIHTDERVISQYAASTVTNYRKNGNAPPEIREGDVSSARNFVMDNKK